MTVDLHPYTTNIFTAFLSIGRISLSYVSDTSIMVSDEVAGYVYD